MMSSSLSLLRPLFFPSLLAEPARSRMAWRNEVCAPELLTLDEDLVNDLLHQVENQQEIVDDAR